jgi:hypothetical protein
MERVIDLMEHQFTRMVGAGHGKQEFRTVVNRSIHFLRGKTMASFRVGLKVTIVIIAKSGDFLNVGGSRFVKAVKSLSTRWKTLTD